MCLPKIFLKRYLLCGDIKSAEDMFKQQQPKSNEEKVSKLIDQGLVAVAQNDYEEAFQHFQKAYEIEKDNILVSCSNILKCSNYRHVLYFLNIAS